jgi:negative regulator of sigma E activity
MKQTLHDDNVQHSTSIHLFGDNFADKVASAIAGETIAPAKPELKSSWGKSFAQLGIAASVALAFFLGMQTIMPQQEQSGTAPVAQQSDTSNSQSLTGVAQTEETLVTEPAIQQVDPEARQRLEDYIRSVSIRPEEPAQLESLQDSPLYRLVNEIQNSQ